MKLRHVLLSLAIVLSAGAVQAADSAIALGESTYGVRCALCHGAEGKADTDIVGLLRQPPADLTKLSERAGGAFPFSDVYHIIVDGMEAVGHGGSDMPIWGDYFIADALEDRGITTADAIHITQGRILSLVYYLESIQE